MTVAIITFAVSLAFAVALFGLKAHETSRGVVYAPRLRARADVHAHRLRYYVRHGIHVVEHIPEFSVLFFQWAVHVSAVAVARMARMAERRAHHIARFVSQKRISRRRARDARLRADNADGENTHLDSSS